MNRIAVHRHLPYIEIAEWFDLALKKSDPRPSREVLDRLGRQLQMLLNRANNSELEEAGPVPLGELKDVSPKEWHDRKIGKLAEAARAFIDASVELEEYAGPIFPCPTGDLSLPELRALLTGIAIFAPPPRPLKPRRGARLVPWRGAGREFARLVAGALKDVGFAGRLGIKDPESVPVIVAAAAISWAYDQKLEPSGFVSAMRGRSRNKR